MTTPATIAKGLSEAQKRAIIEGRVAECYVKHPAGTKCPNCATWPFKKGGASAFIKTMRAYLENSHEAK